MKIFKVYAVRPDNKIPMCISKYFQSSIGRKQIVAVTGLMMILFLVGHLAGNLFFFGGPKAFNAYADKLAHLRPGLLVVEFGLLFIFLAHIYFTVTLVIENRQACLSGRQARLQRYSVANPKGGRSLATRLMPFTGTVLFAFVIYHLLDFTFIDHYGPKSYLADGRSYGLYGLVYNSFTDVRHSLFYIVAMLCVGFHLYHGIKSVIQTFGVEDRGWVPIMTGVALVFSLLISLGFSSIPVYVLMQ